MRNTLAEQDIKFSFLEGRGNLVLNNFSSGTVTDYLTVLLKSLDTTYINSYGCVELKCTTAGGSLGVTKHYAHLLTKLVNEYNGTIGLAYNTGELS